jgi:hypothetical protein
LERLGIRQAKSPLAGPETFNAVHPILPVYISFQPKIREELPATVPFLQQKIVELRVRMW